MAAAFCAAAMAFATAIANPRSPVAVLPLAAAQGYDAYAVAPSAAQLAMLTMQVRSGLAMRPLDLALLAQARVSPVACADEDCARRVGSRLGAHTVVFGTVRRSAGIVWTAHLCALDVASGRVIDTLTYGVLGDYDSLLRGVSELGTCLGRSIDGKSRCKENSPAF